MTKETEQQKANINLASILDSLKAFGPNVKEIPSFIEQLPYAPFSKQERLGKVADWTAPSSDASKDSTAPPTSFRRKRQDEQAAHQASLPPTLFNYQHQEVEDSSFSVVDRQTATLKKSAVRSVRPSGSSFSRASVTSNTSGGASARNSTVSQGGRYSTTKRPTRFGQQNVRVRDASIKVQAGWKLIEELDFNRMTNLYFETGDAEDLSVCGYLNYYDKAFDRVTVKTETNMPSSIPPEKGTYHPAPNPSSDHLLKSLAQQVAKEAKEEADKNAGDDQVYPTKTVISSDVIIAALMSCTKSVYSWDLVVDKRGDVLTLDKRDGGALDFNFVNENAADPPAEALEKDTNINSHTALANEATLLNQVYPAHIAKPDEKLVFKTPNPFTESPEEMIPTAVSSGAERYRKWEMDNVNLVLRTRVHACMHTKNLVPAPIPAIESSALELSETALVNIYALNEFDHRAPGSGNSFEWRKKLDSQRGAVIATEMKNNAVKLARWTMESLLSGVDYMRLGFVSRVAARSRNKHQILGSQLVKPNDFVRQIAFNIGNGWGIVKAIIDVCFNLPDGKYILLRDPVKPALVLYLVSSAKEKVTVD